MGVLGEEGLKKRLCPCRKGQINVLCFSPKPPGGPEGQAEKQAKQEEKDCHASNRPGCSRRTTGGPQAEQATPGRKDWNEGRRSQGRTDGKRRGRGLAGNRQTKSGRRGNASVYVGTNQCISMYLDSYQQALVAAGKDRKEARARTLSFKHGQYKLKRM